MASTSFLEVWCKVGAHITNGSGLNRKNSKSDAKFVASFQPLDSALLRADTSAGPSCRFENIHFQRALGEKVWATQLASANTLRQPVGRQGEKRNGGRAVSVKSTEPRETEGSGLPVVEGRAKDEEEGEDWDGQDEEWDEEELDELFEQFGETVLEDPEVARAEREAADEEESRALSVALAAAANEVKGAGITVLHVKPLVYWTRYFVIATAFSRPQADAIGKRMKDTALERFERRPVGGDRQQASNGWTLIDFGDVVVHLFMPKERAFYNLEEFYGNAPRVDLPFEVSKELDRLD